MTGAIRLGYNWSRGLGLGLQLGNCKRTTPSMDTYQPIFDAVRSRISNGDIGAAVENALRDSSLGHYAAQAAESVRQACSEHERPSAIYRPTLSRDGNAWCALYGDDLQSGVAAFGNSPAQAMSAFDAEWFKRIA